MRSLKEEQLIPLRNTLREVQKFIREFVNEAEQKILPYYYFRFDDMINNIEICLQSEELDLRQISAILERDWRSANHELIGIPGCENFAKGIEKKEITAYRFAELLIVVEEYFEEDGETFWTERRSNK